MQVRLKRERIESVAFFGGLAAVGLEWLAVAIFYLSLPAGFSGDKPLSYFATLPQTRFIFAACFGLAAVSLWTFFTWHLGRHYITPRKTFAFSMLAYVAVAVFPFNLADLLSATVHKLLAFIVTISFILGIYLLARNNPDKKLRLFSFPIVAISSLLFLLIAFLPNSPFFLFIEIAVGFCLQLWTIGITYHSYRRMKRKDEILSI